MKCYHIVSRLHGLLLDLENGGNKPVPRVVPWKRTIQDSQLWYDDQTTGTIRNKSNDWCIDLEGDIAIVKPYTEKDSNQQWERHENSIRHRKSHKVLDILESKTEPGAEVGPYKYRGSPNQMWNFEFIDDSPWDTSGPTDPAADARRFFITSELNQLVVDIAGADADEGTKIITWPKNEDLQRNQLWYIDQQGYIRSDLNDMVFGNEEQGDKLKMKKFSNDPRTQWVIKDKKIIINRVGEVLDIRGEKGGKGAELCSFQYKGADNQHWRINYV